MPHTHTTLAILPPPDIAALAISAVASAAPEQIAEPYRWAACELGWGHADGTLWWSDTMGCID